MNPKKSDILGGMNSRIGRTQWIQIISIAFGASVIAFWRIGGKPFWIDEVCSVRFSALKLSAIARSDPANPPLFCYILHFWRIIAPNSEGGMRALPAILGIAAVLSEWRIGSKIGNGSVGFCAACMLAISSFHLAFCQELRSYTMEGVAGLWSTFLLMRCAKAGGRAIRLQWATVTLAMLYGHNWGLLLFVSEIFALKLAYGKTISQLGLSGETLIVLALYLPWVYATTSSLAEGVSVFQPHAGYGAVEFKRFLGAYTGAFCRVGAAGGLHIPFSLILTVFFAYGAAALYAVFTWEKWEADFRYLSLCFTGTIFLALLLASFKIPVFKGDRYPYVVFPIFILCLSRVVLSLTRPMRAAFFGIFLVCSVVGIFELSQGRG